jgi:hypothetical protein
MRQLTVGIVVGVLIGFGVEAVVAQPSVRWNKSEVLPIVIVEPTMGLFRPKDGSAMQASWGKDEVTPMCLVKPRVGGFVPVEASPLGDTWTKDEVKPYLPVKYSMGVFVPSE